VTARKITTILSLLVLSALLVMTAVMVLVLTRESEVIEDEEVYWVLWVRYESIDYIEKESSQVYRLIEVYPSLKSCDEAKVKLWRKKYKMISEAIEEDEDKPQISPEKCCAINTSVKDQWFTSSRYLCLPDTTNPQEWGRWKNEEDNN